MATLICVIKTAGHLGDSPFVAEFGWYLAYSELGYLFAEISSAIER